MAVSAGQQVSAGSQHQTPEADVQHCQQLEQKEVGLLAKQWLSAFPVHACLSCKRFRESRVEPARRCGEETTFWSGLTAAGMKYLSRNVSTAHCKAEVLVRSKDTGHHSVPSSGSAAKQGRGPKIQEVNKAGRKKTILVWRPVGLWNGDVWGALYKSKISSPISLSY